MLNTSQIFCRQFGLYINLYLKADFAIVIILIIKSVEAILRLLDLVTKIITILKLSD